jgi:hypothetical protein
MSDNPNNAFEAAIAALEGHRELVNAKIDAEIAKLKEIGERMSGVDFTSGPPLSVPAKLSRAPSTA